MTDEERAAYDALIKAARRIDAMWYEWHHRKIPFGSTGFRYDRDGILNGLPALREALKKVPQ